VNVLHLPSCILGACTATLSCCDLLPMMLLSAKVRLRRRPRRRRGVVEPAADACPPRRRRQDVREGEAGTPRARRHGAAPAATRRPQRRQPAAGLTTVFTWSSLRQSAAVYSSSTLRCFSASTAIARFVVPRFQSAVPFLA